MKKSRISRGMPYIKKIERGLSTTSKWGILNGHKRGEMNLDREIRILVAGEDPAFLRSFLSDF
jgi:hypothetical protein